MIDVQAVVFGRLTADATLTAQLATYGDAPAVFEDGKVPADLVADDDPFVVVTPPTNDANDEDFSAARRVETIAMRLYHKPQGSSLSLQIAAERVRALFRNWGPASVTGGSVLHASVAGPSPAPTDDPSLDGRIVSVSLIIKES